MTFTWAAKGQEGVLIIHRFGSGDLAVNVCCAAVTLVHDN